MSTDNIGEMVEVRQALAPIVVDDAPVIEGATILNAHKVGRQLSFILAAGAMAATDALAIEVEGSLDGGTTWENVKDKDGNDLVFTLSKVSDGGQLEDGVLIGTIPLDRANKRDLTNDSVRDTPFYDAYRITAVNAVAQDVLLSAVAVISDLFERASVEVDDLLLKVLPAPTL